MKKIIKNIQYIFFLQGIVLSCLMMMYTTSYAQQDTTVTYTFNDTTITFNIQEVTEMLETTDLMPIEIKQLLEYEPFWHSLFPPVNQSSQNEEEEEDNDDEEEDNDDDEEEEEEEEDGERLMSVGCLEFDNLIYDPTTNEIIDGYPWSPQIGCVDYQDTSYPLDYMDVAWSFQNDCPTDNTMTYSQGAFTVVQSTPNVYDTKVLKHLGGGVFDNQLLELNAPSGKSEFIRLGDQTGGFHAHRLVGTFTVTSTNPILKYNYAVALHDAGPNHDGATLGNTGRPYYTFRFKTGSDPTWTDIPCTEFTTVGAASPSSIFQTQDIYIDPYVPAPTASPPYAMPNGFFVDWQQNIVDLTAYIGQQVQVEISLVECNEGGHSGWLYVDMFCDSSTFDAEAYTDDCQTYSFSTSYTGNYGDGNETYYWDFGDGNTSTDSNPTHTYSAPGSYNITLNLEYINYPNGLDVNMAETCYISTSAIVDVCCGSCESSFAPIPGKQYVLSAWTRENNTIGALTYTDPAIGLFFEGPNSTVGPFLPKGEIIDGWQRIEEEFTVPIDAEKINVRLLNNGSQDVFFDDIRIHPFDASMKSFVYDPVTLRLSAELDERNYATYYEYDEEGALIRIKKETERGVMTIQESRNGIQKRN